MSIVRIGPEPISVVDVLEYAKALIKEHGWRQGARPQDLGGSNEQEWETISASGVSLHDAIGMACFRLSGETGSALGVGRSRDKDFPTSGRSGGLRTQATNAVQAKIRSRIKRSQNDIEFNDKAKTVDAVYSVLDAAIKEASSASNG